MPSGNREESSVSTGLDLSVAWCSVAVSWKPKSEHSTRIRSQRQKASDSCWCDRDAGGTLGLACGEKPPSRDDQPPAPEMSGLSNDLRWARTFAQGPDRAHALPCRTDQGGTEGHGDCGCLAVASTNVPQESTASELLETTYLRTRWKRSDHRREIMARMMLQSWGIRGEILGVGIHRFPNGRGDVRKARIERATSLGNRVPRPLESTSFCWA